MANETKILFSLSFFSLKDKLKCILFFLKATLKYFNIWILLKENLAKDYYYFIDKRSLFECFEDSYFLIVIIWYGIFILLRINTEADVIIFRTYSNREAFIEKLLYPHLRQFRCVQIDTVYIRKHGIYEFIVKCIKITILFFSIYLFIVDNNISIISSISFKSSHSKFISIKFKNKILNFSYRHANLYFHPFRANKIHWSCCRRTTECATSAYTKT